jgi:hypothetical protein
MSSNKELVTKNKKIRDLTEKLSEAFDKLSSKGREIRFYFRE